MKDEYRLLEDFPVKPYADPYDIKDPGYQAYPINYYDNDDGFWDEYLKQKHKKYEKYAWEKMIVGRPFFKH